MLINKLDSFVVNKSLSGRYYETAKMKERREASKWIDLFARNCLMRLFDYDWGDITMEEWQAIDQGKILYPFGAYAIPEPKRTDEIEYIGIINKGGSTILYLQGEEEQIGQLEYEMFGKVIRL